MLSHCENVRTQNSGKKSKEKKRNFFQQFTKAHKDLIQVKKNSKLSHACVPLSDKHLVVENNKIPVQMRHSRATRTVFEFPVHMSYRAHCLNLKLLSGKLSHFSHIWRAFGALMCLLKPKGRGGGGGEAKYKCFNVLKSKLHLPVPTLSTQLELTFKSKERAPSGR